MFCVFNYPLSLLELSWRTASPCVMICSDVHSLSFSLPLIFLLLQMLAQAEAAGEAAALVFLRAAPSSVAPDHLHEAPSDGGVLVSLKKSKKSSSASSSGNTRGMRKYINSSKRDALYHANAASWLSSGVGYRYGSPPFFDKRVSKALLADDKGLGHAEQVGKVLKHIRVKCLHGLLVCHVTVFI